MTANNPAHSPLTHTENFNLQAIGSFVPKAVLDAVQAAKADVFDLDGTLLDNEGMALDQMQKVIATTLGLELPQSLVRTLAGRPKEYIVRRCIDIGGMDRDLTDTEMRNVLEKITEARAALTDDDKIETMPGILPFLAHRERQGISRMINTSSERMRAELHVNHFSDLSAYFKNVAGELNMISCETDFGPDYVKPHIRGYVTAIDRARIHGNSTVTYEDTVSGVVSAKGAGIKTIIGVVGGSHIFDRQERSNELLEAGAAGVINDFRELIPSLQLKAV